MKKNLCFVLKHTMKCHPALLLLCILSAATGIVIPVVTTFLPKVVIEYITAAKGIKTTVLVTVAGTVLLALCMGIKVFLDKLVFFHKLRMNTYYMELVAGKGMTADYCHQETERFRKLQSESIAACNGNFSPLTQVYDVGIALCTSGLGFFLYFGILTQLNVYLVLFLVLTTLIGYLLNHRLLRWMEKNQTERAGYQQKTGYLTQVSGDLKSAKDIRLYRMTGWLGDIYQKNIKELAGWYRRYTKQVFGVAAGESGLSLLRECAAYVYLIYRVVNGTLAVADFVLYFGIITGFSTWLSALFGQAVLLRRIGMTVNHLRTFLDYPDKYLQDDGYWSEELQEVPKEISFRNVCYRYEGAEQDTLSGLNLTIAPKEHLAVVGLNGAGKTTLVKLLCGLTDPSEGMVCYDGVDVKEYNRKKYFQMFSAVFQQFSLLPVTFAEAVAETEPSEIDRRKAEACLRTAGLWEKISSYGKGMDSEYGREVNDEGTELSGGQIQKLLLARALYRNAPVMVLDEPTAALDPIAESSLYEIYNEVMKDCSAVFISHRLASTRFCDRIVLVEDGRITEEGTHAELLAKRGRYYELYETQAEYYREYLPEGGVAE
ncbi:MAG: ABC transporter ATP-binding protein [Lachnospiraceae bacterium]|nr:ABC transporter ATP-binding protein [Lachnospiraceae bacterium]